MMYTSCNIYYIKYIYICKINIIDQYLVLSAKQTKYKNKGNCILYFLFCVNQV